MNVSVKTVIIYAAAVNISATFIVWLGPMLIVQRKATTRNALTSASGSLPIPVRLGAERLSGSALGVPVLILRRAHALQLKMETTAT